MKTSEFKEKLKDYSLYVGETEEYFILNYCNACIAEVSKTRQGSLSIYSMPFKQLVYTLIEYAETPISEREEAKKYRVRIPDMAERTQVYALCKLANGCVVINQTNERNFQEHDRYHITESEIKRHHEYLWQFAKEVKDET
jgi:hypothetical protein